MYRDGCVISITSFDPRFVLPRGLKAATEYEYSGLVSWPVDATWFKGGNRI